MPKWKHLSFSYMRNYIRATAHWICVEGTPTERRLWKLLSEAKCRKAQPFTHIHSATFHATSTRYWRISWRITSVNDSQTFIFQARQCMENYYNS